LTNEVRLSLADEQGARKHRRKFWFDPCRSRETARAAQEQRRNPPNSPSSKSVQQSFLHTSPIPARSPVLGRFSSAGSPLLQRSRRTKSPADRTRRSRRRSAGRTPTNSIWARSFVSRGEASRAFTCFVATTRIGSPPLIQGYQPQRSHPSPSSIRDLTEFPVRSTTSG
jgi:hypothetical protein